MKDWDRVQGLGLWRDEGLGFLGFRNEVLGFTVCIPEIITQNPSKDAIMLYTLFPRISGFRADFVTLEVSENVSGCSPLIDVLNIILQRALTIPKP